MKIGHTADKTATVGNTASTTSSSAANTASTASSTSTTAIPSTADPSAKIQLSSTASSLLSSSSTPEFDAQKVAQMSDAIQKGNYKVNHGAIADKLISNAKEVLGKVSS